MSGLWLLISALMPSCSRATGSPGWGPVPAMERLKAPQVVVARLTTTSNSALKSLPRHWPKIVQLRVLASYKGNLKPGSVIPLRTATLTFEGPDSGFSSLVKKPRLFFLDNRKDKKHAPFSEVEPSFRVLRKRPRISPGSSFANSVGHELTNNLQHGDTALVAASYRLLWNSPAGIASARREATLARWKTNRIRRAAALSYRLQYEDLSSANTRSALEIALFKLAADCSNRKSQSISGVSLTDVTMDLIQNIPRLAPTVTSSFLGTLLQIALPDKSISGDSDQSNWIETSIAEILRIIGTQEVARSRREFIPLAVRIMRHSRDRQNRMDAFMLLLNVHPGPDPTWEQLDKNPDYYFKQYCDWGDSVTKHRKTPPKALHSQQRNKRNS